MKKTLRSFTAAAVSAAILSTSPTFLTVFAESDTAEPATVTLSFNLSEEGITICPDEDDNPQVIEPVVGEPNSSFLIPTPKIEKEGYGFSGWTVDGVFGYRPGDVFVMGDKDVTMTPVWYDLEDEETHAITYKVEIDGEVVDTKKTLPKKNLLKNQFCEIAWTSFVADGLFQLGWIVDGTHFLGQQKYIVSDHDVEIVPNWLKIYTVYYSAGDVDRISGGKSGSVTHPETISFELAADSTFKRKGFEFAGWSSSLDDKVHYPNETVVMPSSDITYTAIWEPINYNVVFNPGVSSAEKIKIRGNTDTYITVPEINTTKTGYYFDGWEINGKKYKPGEQYLIEGAEPGLGIMFKAVWVEGEAPPTEPTLLGDANCDKNVNMADAVFVMQSILNADEYGLGKPDGITELGQLNGDVYNPGSGLTNSDALAIQEFTLGLCSLPVNEVIA